MAQPTAAEAAENPTKGVAHSYCSWAQDGLPDYFKCLVRCACLPLVSMLFSCGPPLLFLDAFQLLPPPFPKDLFAGMLLPQPLHPEGKNCHMPGWPLDTTHCTLAGPQGLG